MEREGLPEHVPSSDCVGALLRKLKNHRYGNHKTFSQWMEFLLEDGTTYLTLHFALRTGKFELRDTSIRHFAPKFMGYGKTNIISCA